MCHQLHKKVYQRNKSLHNLLRNIYSLNYITFAEMGVRMVLVPKYLWRYLGQTISWVRLGVRRQCILIRISYVGSPALFTLFIHHPFCHYKWKPSFSVLEESACILTRVVLYDSASGSFALKFESLHIKLVFI